MATATVNGVKLFYELTGRGEIRIVLVHASWVSHRTWERVVPLLADSFRVLTYDRRGHGESERPATPGSIREDVADLAALIEHLKLGRPWVAGNSDLDWIKRCARPVLLTEGDRSPPAFGPVIARLASVLPRAESATLPGAGHIPHVTHPNDYVDAVRAFIRKHTA